LTIEIGIKKNSKISISWRCLLLFVFLKYKLVLDFKGFDEELNDEVRVVH